MSMQCNIRIFIDKLAFSFAKKRKYHVMSKQYQALNVQRMHSNKFARENDEKAFHVILF